MTDKKYWITPPEFLGRLHQEFKFDFDPCPFPRPHDYNSLVIPWGKSNYVNPPFMKKDAPYGGPSAFVRKAITEQQKGNTSVFVLPLPWNLSLLMAAGAEMRYGGVVQWVDAETGKPGPRARPQVVAILRGSAQTVCSPGADVPESNARGWEPRYETFSRQGLINECRMLREGLHRLATEANSLHLQHHKAMRSRSRKCVLCDSPTSSPRRTIPEK